MNRKMKAILLSALVLPGLGQLYMGRKIRGGLLILLVNLFLLVALAVVLSALLPAMIEMSQSGTPDPVELLRHARGTAAVKWLLLFFIALWGYAIADLAFGPASKEAEEENTDGPAST